MLTDLAIALWLADGFIGIVYLVALAVFRRQGKELPHIVERGAWVVGVGLLASGFVFFLLHSA